MRRARYETGRESDQAALVLPEKTQVRVALPARHRTRVDDRFVQGVILAKKTSGYTIGTLDGIIERTVPFDQVEDITENVMSSDVLQATAIPQRKVTLRMVGMNQNLGHPGTAHFRCEYSKGNSVRCVCRVKGRDCTSHCRCRRSLCTNNKE